MDNFLKAYVDFIKRPVLSFSFLFGLAVITGLQEPEETRNGAWWVVGAVVAQLLLVYVLLPLVRIARAPTKWKLRRYRAVCSIIFVVQLLGGFSAFLSILHKGNLSYALLGSVIKAADAVNASPASYGIGLFIFASALIRTGLEVKSTPANSEQTGLATHGQHRRGIAVVLRGIRIKVSRLGRALR